MTTVHAPISGALNTTWQNVPTHTINGGGVEFAYRQLGPRTGVPVVFLTHLAAVLDNWDPRVVDGIAAKHRVITFDNRGVGASSGRRRRPSRRWRGTPSPSSAPSASIRSTSSGSPWAA
jgi:pimeloyl-ACP methyl ester carboxylesterase